MSQKHSSTDTMLDNSASKSSIDKGQQNSPKRTTADKSSLVSQNTEGRFKGKHSRKTSESSLFQKKAKRRPRDQQLPPNACTCVRCSYDGAIANCCAQVLDAIDEEYEVDGQFSKTWKRVPEVIPCLSDLSSQRNPYCQCNKKSEPYKEDVPCVEFFDVMRDTMEKAVKKSLDKLIEEYFICVMNKIDLLDCQVKRNECILSNIYTDLSEKIAYFGKRNDQQFGYLCMRTKNDRFIHQQDQEDFWKSTKAAGPCQDSLEIEKDIPSGEELVSNEDEYISAEEDQMSGKDLDDRAGKIADEEAV